MVEQTGLYASGSDHAAEALQAVLDLDRRSQFLAVAGMDSRLLLHAERKRDEGHQVFGDS